MNILGNFISKTTVSAIMEPQSIHGLSAGTFVAHVKKGKSASWFKRSAMRFGPAWEIDPDR